MAVVRFAPSPTGSLHLGNARIALLNFLYVKKYGGKAILRMDDTDQDRCSIECIEKIKDDLAWMGLEWEETFFQSRRQALYLEALQKLKDMGRAYPCYETPEELDFKRNLQRRQGKPPVYDREALNLTLEQKEKFEKEGCSPYWRFLLDRDKTVSWTDLGGRKMEFQMSSISDPVLVRQDGLPLYTLSSVVDDGLMEVTHVIRGDDHITNTAVQIQMFDALGYLAPEAIHLGLITDEQGKPLSKRSGKASIENVRKEFEPMSFNLALGELGHSRSFKPCLSLDELAEAVDFAALGSSSVRFSLSRLEQLNRWVLRNLDFCVAKDKIPSPQISNPRAEEFWSVIRPNVRSWKHAGHWYDLVFEESQVDFRKKTCPVNSNLFPIIKEEVKRGEWENLLQGKSNFSIADLNAGIRWMLTGEESGPRTLDLLSFIAPAVMEKRLETARRLLESKGKSL